MNYYKQDNKKLISLQNLYHTMKPVIEERLSEFDLIWKNGTDRELFIELVFCLLTPQSSAKRCWEAVCSLLERDDLFSGGFNEIRKHLQIVRFLNNKTRYILEARAKFIDTNGLREILAPKPTVEDKRLWLVDNVKGMGFKEASHYLRNIGLGEDIAILDRHILRNLELLEVIPEIPAALTKRQYLDIEEKTIHFAQHIGIPPSHLDLLLWYNETGEVFK